MSEKLKPCPFCGSEVEIQRIDDSCYTIKCQFCPCMFDWFNRRKDAVKAWNRRVKNE